MRPSYTNLVCRILVGLAIGRIVLSSTFGLEPNTAIPRDSLIPLMEASVAAAMICTLIPLIPKKLQPVLEKSIQGVRSMASRTSAMRSEDNILLHSMPTRTEHSDQNSIRPDSL